MTITKSAGWRWIKSRTMQHLHDDHGGLCISMPAPGNKNYFREGDKRRHEAAIIIAAAPDGLAFAEMVLIKTGRRGANADINHPDRKIWEASRAFIAKATGAA